VPQRRRRTSPAPPRQGRPRLAAASRTWLLASCCVLRCLQYWVTVLLLTLIWWVVVFLRRFALVFIELKVIALRYAWGSRGICFDHVRFQLPSSLQCYAWCLSLLFHTRHKSRDTWYWVSSGCTGQGRREGGLRGAWHPRQAANLTLHT
jgi:hypothetical protein